MLSRLPAFLRIPAAGKTGGALWSVRATGRWSGLGGLVFALVMAGSLMAGSLLTPAQAHFQLVYTPEVNPGKAGPVPVKLIFWHPLENGPVMDMARPEAFQVFHKGKKTDLLSTLSPMTFTGESNSAAAFDAVVPVTRAGDYVLVLTPAPYLETSEDKYIQQITKSFLNLGGIPTGWSEPLNLPAEIVPLSKPTNILAGSTFTGQILSNGKPVAGAEIEVAYLVAEPDMQNNRPLPAQGVTMPGGAIVIMSDANGVFTFGIPRAGFWGFAALGVGEKKKYENKPLSQDAVIWVRAYALN